MGSYDEWLDEMRFGMKGLRPEAKVFFFVRHGTTSMNKDGLMIGHADVSLDADGHEQVKTLVKKSKGLDVTSIYSSDLIRAKQTALAIAEALALPIVFDVRLRTRDYGSLQGKKKPSGNSVVTPADAEPVLHFTQRLTAVFNEILSRRIERPLIISHGGVRDALGIALGIPHKQETRSTSVLLKFEQVESQWRSDLIQ